jgi:hypothetical protein
MTGKRGEKTADPPNVDLRKWTREFTERLYLDRDFGVLAEIPHPSCEYHVVQLGMSPPPSAGPAGIVKHTFTSAARFSRLRRQERERAAAKGRLP